MMKFEEHIFQMGRNHQLQVVEVGMFTPNFNRSPRGQAPPKRIVFQAFEKAAFFWGGSCETWRVWCILLFHGFLNMQNQTVWCRIVLNQQ